MSVAIQSIGHIFAFGADTWNHSGWLYHSTDDGATWTQSETYSGDDVPSFAFNSSSNIFMGRGCSTVLRSSDYGVNWTQVLTGHTVGALAINSSGYIFAGTGAGVFRSGDDGGSWSQAIIETKTGAGSLVINSSG